MGKVRKVRMEYCEDEIRKEEKLGVKRIDPNIPSGLIACICSPLYFFAYGKTVKQ